MWATSILWKGKYIHGSCLDVKNGRQFFFFLFMFVACSFANELKISGGCANTDQDLWKKGNKYGEIITLSKMKCDGIDVVVGDFHRWFSEHSMIEIFLIKYWTGGILE